jgi:hypothetical protein
VTALEASPKLSGHLILLVSMLVIVMRCCSTSLANFTSPTNDMEKRYTAVRIGDLYLVSMSYVHSMNHLMVIICAIQLQIEIDILSLLKMVRTASLTRRMETSQLQRLKYGKSKKW